MKRNFLSMAALFVTAMPVAVWARCDCFRNGWQTYRLECNGSIVIGNIDTYNQCLDRASHYLNVTSGKRKCTCESQQGGYVYILDCKEGGYTKLMGRFYSKSQCETVKSGY